VTVADKSYSDKLTCQNTLWPGDVLYPDEIIYQRQVGDANVIAEKVLVKSARFNDAMAEWNPSIDDLQVPKGTTVLEYPIQPLTRIWDGSNMVVPTSEADFEKPQTVRSLSLLRVAAYLFLITGISSVVYVLLKAFRLSSLRDK